MMIADSNFLDKIFRFLQKKLGGQEGHESLGISASKTNIMMWGLFMSSSMRAVIHHGQNYKKNLETCKFTNFDQIENFFSVTQNLVADNPFGILNVKTIDPRSLCWTRSTLAHNQVKSWTKAKVRVYSDYVLCLGRVSSGEEVIARWSNQVTEFQVHYPVEEFWTLMEKQLNSSCIFSQDSRHCKFYDRSRMTYRVRISPQSSSLTESSLCPCSTTSNVQRQIMKKFVLRIHNKWKSTHNDFKQVIGLSSVPEMNGNGMEQEITDQKEDGKLQQQIRIFKETNHPVFSSVSALSRGIWNKWKTRLPYIWTLRWRILNDCSELYSLRISSVFTEQLRTDSDYKLGIRQFTEKTWTKGWWTVWHHVKWVLWCQLQDW